MIDNIASYKTSNIYDFRTYCLLVDTSFCIGLLLVQDVTVSQSAIEGKHFQTLCTFYSSPALHMLSVLGALASQVSSSEIPRKLMQRTIQMVKNECYTLYTLCGLVSRPVM